MKPGRKGETRDRGGWRPGKLERLGQPEDWNLEDWEYGSPDHLSAGDREREAAEGGRRVSLPGFLRWGAGSRECAPCCLPSRNFAGRPRHPRTGLPGPVSGEASLEPGSLASLPPGPWGSSQTPKAIRVPGLFAPAQPLLGCPAWA